MMVKSSSVVIVLLLVCLFAPMQSIAADRVRFAYPAKSLNYLPVTLGRDKGIFLSEGIDLQMILVASTIQVAALTTGDIDFSGAQSQVMAGAARGLPVKVVGFLTVKPSFWLNRVLTVSDWFLMGAALRSEDSSDVPPTPSTMR